MVLETTAATVMLWSGVASAVGGGISAYNSFQSAATQKNIANYNYAMQMKQAQQQQMMTSAQAAQMEQQARFQEAQARINAAMAQSEAQARHNNAQTLRNMAEGQAAVDRENVRRSRMDGERMMAAQRAAAVKSGTVLETFSNRDIGTESARELEMALNEMHYQSDLGRRKTFAEAALEDFGGSLAEAGAKLDLASGLAEAQLQRDTAGMKELEGRVGYSMDQRRATISRTSGLASARGSQMEGWGTLFKTAGSVGSSWGNWQSNKDLSARKSASTGTNGSF